MMDEKHKKATPILIIFASVDGMTQRICESIARVLQQDQSSVTLVSVDEYDAEIADFDKVLIASSIRYGKHHSKITTFIQDNATLLNAKKSAFISVNLVARKVEKRTADTNPYVVKFLKNISWKPARVAVFAGKIDYPHYGFWDRIMIQLIMRLTKGPTDPKTVIEYTDWDQVDAFARSFSEW